LGDSNHVAAVLLEVRFAANIFTLDSAFMAYKMSVVLSAMAQYLLLALFINNLVRAEQAFAAAFLLDFKH
jgi:hypothetical protein